MVNQHQTRLQSIDEYLDATDIQANVFRNKLALFGQELSEFREAGITFRAQFDTEKICREKREITTEALSQNLGLVSASVRTLGGKYSI